MTVNLSSVVTDFSRNYLTTNKNASEDNLRVALKEHLTESRKTLGLSKKQIAAANAMVGDVFKSLTTPPSPKVEASKKVLNGTAAMTAYDKPKTDAAKSGKYYDKFVNRSRKARRNAHIRNLADAKTAFGDAKYLEFLKEKHPDLYLSVLLDAEAAKKPSNNQGKREVRASEDTYVSSKKKKNKAKKNNVNPGKNRNADVSEVKTQPKVVKKPKMKMTESARRIYNEINERLHAKKPFTLPIDVPNTELNKLNDYFRELENAAKDVAKETAETASETVKNAGKEVSKSGKGKWGIVAAGIAALATGIGIVSTKTETPKPETQEIDEAA